MTKMAGGPEVEEDSGGDVAGAPAVRFSARRKRWSRRISWVLWVAVRSTVATANGVGDDELRSGACREESRGENGVQGKRGRAGRLRAAAWRLHAWIGSKGEASSAKQEVAGVDARHASPLLVLLAEEEEDKGGGGGLGRLGELGRLWWLRG